MKDRITILKEAEQLAHETIDMCVALNDAQLKQYRANNLSDDEIVTQLAIEFLRDTTDYLEDAEELSYMEDGNDTEDANGQ